MLTMPSCLQTLRVYNMQILRRMMIMFLKPIRTKYIWHRWRDSLREGNSGVGEGTRGCLSGNNVRNELSTLVSSSYRETILLHGNEATEI